MSRILTLDRPSIARVRLHARKQVQFAAAAAPGWFDPTPAVELHEDRVLGELKIAELIASRDPQKVRLALNALNDRMQVYGDLITGNSTVRLSSSALFPDQTTQGVPNAIILGDAERQRIDTRWTALFSIQDRRAQTHPYFKMTDVYHAVTVDEYIMGERIKMGFVEAGDVTYEAKIYGTGLQWNQLWSEWQDVWSIAQGMTAMQVKWAKKQKSLAYATITASGLATVAYDSTGSSTLEKDINTINTAMLEIRKGLYEATAPKGGQQLEEEVSDNEPYYLLYNNLTAGYEDRIRAALEARFTMANDNMSVAEVNRPVVPIGDPDVPTGAWYMGVGGRKNVLAQFRDLRFYSMQDVQVAGVAQGEVGQGAYRFVRGDANQWRQVAVSE